MTYTEGLISKTVAEETPDASWVTTAIKKKRQEGAFFYNVWISEVTFLEMKEWISCDSDFQKCRLLLVRTRWNKKQWYYFKKIF